MMKVSSKPSLPVDSRTEESLINVSAAVRACWFSINCEVKLTVLNGVFITLVAPSRPSVPPCATWPPA